MTNTERPAMTRDEVLSEFTESWDGIEVLSTKRMADAIVHLRERLAAVEKAHAKAMDMLRETAVMIDRVERMTTVCEMAQILTVLPYFGLLTESDWADFCKAVKALDTNTSGNA